MRIAKQETNTKKIFSIFLLVEIQCTDDIYHSRINLEITINLKIHNLILYRLQVAV